MIELKKEKNMPFKKTKIHGAHFLIHMMSRMYVEMTQGCSVQICMTADLFCHSLNPRIDVQGRTP